MAEEVPSGGPIFHVPIADTCRRERVKIPHIIVRCIAEVERRGLDDVGIYRVSGLTTQMNNLSEAFDTDSNSTMLDDVEINTVAGLLKLYLRQLPECLFTSKLYPEFIKTFFTLNNDTCTTSYDPDPDLPPGTKAMMILFSSLPTVNKNIILYLLDHLVLVSTHEAQNKMSLKNIATVFGPTLIHAEVSSPDCMMDVVTEAEILLFFLARVAQGLPIELPETSE